MDRIEEKHTIKMTRKQICRDIDSGFLNANPEYLKAWYRYGLRHSPEHDLYPTVRAELLEGLCAEARKKEEVFELIKFFAGKRIILGQPVPLLVSKLIGSFLLGEFAPIGTGSGRRKNWGRDIIIMMAMKDVLRTKSVHATHRRNLSSDPAKMRKAKKSASEIVQIALIGTEIGAIDVHRIHRIWEDPEKRTELELFWKLRILSEWDDEPEAVRV